MECPVWAECQTARIVEPGHDSCLPARINDSPFLTAEGQSGRKCGDDDGSSIWSSGQVEMHDDPPVLQVEFWLRCGAPFMQFYLSQAPVSRYDHDGTARVRRYDDESG
jgi:hypothetical protein